MTALSFVNPGEISHKAFTKFGMNAKPNSDNPIGFFGTGLKYALAIIHRLGGEVTIYSGLAKYEFKVSTEEFRGKQFKELFYRKGRGAWQEMPFTTELGKTWEPWMAFRELYCNARDEGGDAYEGEWKRQSDTTVIVVSGVPALLEAFHQRNSFMLNTEDRKPVSTSYEMDVYTGHTNGIYYRGILVGQTDKSHELIYNIKTQVDLTEDRTLKHQYMFPYLVAKHWLTRGKEQEALLRQVLTTERGSFEAGLPWSSSPYDPSPEFLEIVTELRGSGAVIHDTVKNLHDKHRAVTGDPEAIAPTAEEQKMIDASVKIIRDQLGYDLSERKIIVCRSLGPTVMGLAHNGKIYLSKRALESGQRWVTGTLLEEYGHLSLNWLDESRDMQNSLINIIAKLLHPASEVPF